MPIATDVVLAYENVVVAVESAAEKGSASSPSPDQGLGLADRLRRALEGDRADVADLSDASAMGRRDRFESLL